MFIRPLPITPQNSKMISGHLHSLFEQYISICHKVSQSGAEWGTKNIYIYNRMQVKTTLGQREDKKKLYSDVLQPGDGECRA